MLHYPDGRRSFNRPEDCRRPLPGDDLACFWICINGRDSRRPGAARLTHQRYKMKIDRMMKAAANKIKRILLPCEFDGGLSMMVSLRGGAISFREQAEWKQKKERKVIILCKCIIELPIQSFYWFVLSKLQDRNTTPLPHTTTGNDHFATIALSFPWQEIYVAANSG